jgi:V-type H+-transporting ATPase subunit E
MEAISQVTQMREFILNEAKDKAEEIDAKALQEFNIEKFKIVNEAKEKVRQDMEKKKKQTDTKAAIEKSTAINRSRLEKIKARQEMLAKVKDGAKDALKKTLGDQGKSKEFITKLIVQGLLMLLEDEVQVNCRAADDGLVQMCLADAASQYSQAVKKESGANKSVNLTLDRANKLPAGGMGGVKLSCAGSSITIDNTIDARLDLVMDQAKPNIRKLMFGK